MALLALGAGGVFYFLFVSHKFEIKNVIISGLETVSEDEVRGAVDNVLGEKKFRFFESRNYFLFSTHKLQTSLLASFPKIGEVEIQKSQQSILDIFVQERDAIGVWCGMHGCFYFDKTGVIFEPAPKSFGSLMITIEDERYLTSTETVPADINGDSPGEISLGSAVLTIEQVVFAGEAQGLVGRNFPFSVRTFRISEEGEYEILTSEGWRVLLDKNAGVEYQLSNLKYVLDEEIETRRHELEYVDLRLGNRVYYKYRGGVDGL